jgi:hypothetical protein
VEEAVGFNNHSRGDNRMIFLQSGIMNLSREPYWYEILGGVLLIPSLIVGVVLSWVLIKKTKRETKKFELEARKFELEIREKEDQSGGPSTGDNVLHRVVETATENRQVQFLILRFILLYIILRGWVIALTIFEPLGEIFKDLADYTSYSLLKIPLFLLSGLFDSLPIAGYIGTALVLGFPLFRDVNKLVGIKKVEDWFKSTIDQAQEKTTERNEAIGIHNEPPTVKLDS